MKDWDSKISQILDKEPAIDKFGLRAPMMEKLVQYSPTRQAKQGRDFEMQQKLETQNSELDLSSPSPTTKREQLKLETLQSLSKMNGPITRVKMRDTFTHSDLEKQLQK